MENIYDLIIVGGGPAGLTAGIYAQRARLKTLLIERELIGGQIALSDVIENYPGFPSISGMSLMEKFEQQARGLGLEIKMEGVEDINNAEPWKVVKTTGSSYRAKAIIISTGAKPRPVGVKGEREFSGKGVSFCATCDGPFFKNQRVVVVGGGDTAVKEAVFLSRLASKVMIVHRRDEFRAEKILQEKIFDTPNVELFLSHVLKEINGDKVVTGVVIEDLKTGARKTIPCEGVFIFVGINSSTNFAKVEKDERGFIKTNEKMETNIEGIFAAGDCRVTPLRQVSTAVGDGATASFMAKEYIEKFKP